MSNTVPVTEMTCSESKSDTQLCYLLLRPILLPVQLLLVFVSTNTKNTSDAKTHVQINIQLQSNIDPHGISRVQTPALRSIGRTRVRMQFNESRTHMRHVTEVCHMTDCNQLSCISRPNISLRNHGMLAVTTATTGCVIRDELVGRLISEQAAMMRPIGEFMQRASLLNIKEPTMADMCVD
jgi:hypothetical protein